MAASILLAATLAVLATHVLRFVAYHRWKGRRTPRFPPSAVIREVGGLLQLGWWSWRAFWSDGLRQPVEITGRPVVAIHGYSQNASNLWGVRRALEARGRPTVGISMVHRFARLPRYVDRLEARLDALGEALGDSFDVVAHSMGAVVLRMLLVRRPDLRPRIRRVVTLGAPHRGTAAVRGLGWTGVPELRALHRRSALLAALPGLRELLPHATITSVAGTTDVIVYPFEDSLEPDTQRIVLRGHGHAGLLTSPEALAAVADALTAP